MSVPKNNPHRDENGKIIPPTGYRMLVEGEWIRQGDIYIKFTSDSWKTTRSRSRFNCIEYWPMARKIGK